MSSRDEFLEAMENWANIYLFRSLTLYFEYLKSSGVSMQQAYALTYLHYHGPCKITDICEHMMVSPAAASQMVARLEKLALVERAEEPGDRRVHKVLLSGDGTEFVRRSIEARQRWAAEMPVEPSGTQLDQITESLQMLSSIYQP